MGWEIIGIFFKVLCVIVLVLGIIEVIIGGVGIIRVTYYEFFEKDIMTMYNDIRKHFIGKEEKKIIKKNVKLNEEETYDKWANRG